MLDDLMPEYDFAERHQRRVEATPDATWSALASLTLDDLTVTRPLLALRHLRASRAPSKPLLTNGPVTLLHREDGRVAIAGAIARPWRPRAPKREVSSLAEFRAFNDAGWTKYLTEFRIEPDGDHGRCTLSTETRGISTDVHARRRFGVYWAIIRVPSGIIRRDILRAVARSVLAPSFGSRRTRAGDPVETVT
jgi:hypothetical protein